MDQIKTILKKIAIFTVVFIVLEVFYSSSLLNQIALTVLALKLTDFLVEVLFIMMPRQKLDKLHEKAVLVTGCDSGFGHDLAQKLDRQGVMVFAGCLFPEGAGALKLKERCSDRLKVLHLDVTNDDHVQAAVETVTSTLQNRKEVLWGVVNNAGIASCGDVELVPLEVFQQSIAVNAIGPVRVTKAFLPLLRKSKGRVVITASISGRRTAGMITTYAMSKHAAVSFADGLREDMMKWSISVHTVEPWLYGTDMGSEEILFGMCKRFWEKTPLAVREDYHEEYLEECKKSIQNIMFTKRPASNVHEVVDDLEHALIGVNPRTRYIPGIVGQIYSRLFLISSTEMFDIFTTLFLPQKINLKK